MVEVGLRPENKTFEEDEDEAELPTLEEPEIILYRTITYNERVLMISIILGIAFLACWKKFCAKRCNLSEKTTPVKVEKDIEKLKVAQKEVDEDRMSLKYDQD